MAVNVKELAVYFSRLVSQGHGKLPVQLMVVEEGITMAADISVSIAQKYDGKRVWVYESEPGIAHMPEWLIKKT